MLLLDTHPDYMCFNGALQRGYEYPSKFYQELLQYIKTQYQGQYWHGTPRELAKWYLATQPLISTGTPPTGPANGLKTKRAAVVLYSYFPADPRPRREAETLAGVGMEVDLICLRELPTDAKSETVNGINVRRISLPRRRDSRFTYLLQYGSFTFLAAIILAVRSLRKRYNLVHVHNMPDVLVFSAVIPKLLGAKVMLDLHDPMPELMMSIFDLGENSVQVRVLKYLERLSIRFADRVITVNRACKRIFSSRSCMPDKIHVAINAPDEEIFTFRKCQEQSERAGDRPFVIMYHGSIVKRHGLDLAVQAFKIARKSIPTVQLRIYGPRTPFLDSVMASVEKNGSEGAVRYVGAQNLHQIRRSISDCDVGIIPNRRSLFTEINTPTRIFEYLSQGKPVIAPLAGGITDYFGKEDLIFFDLGNAEDLARKIVYVWSESRRVTDTVKRGQAIYLEYRWNRERERFLHLVGELLSVQ